MRFRHEDASTGKDGLGRGRKAGDRADPRTAARSCSFRYRNWRPREVNMTCLGKKLKHHLGLIAPGQTSDTQGWTRPLELLSPVVERMQGKQSHSQRNRSIQAAEALRVKEGRGDPCQVSHMQAARASEICWLFRLACTRYRLEPHWVQVRN